MLREIDSQELTEWLAYARVEPFGEERADLRAGIVAATTANVHRDPKKRRRAYKAEDFIPTFGPKQAKPWQELLQYVEHLNMALGGRDLRQQKTEE